MLNLRVHEVHSKEAFFVEDEGGADKDAGFFGLWMAADDCAIEGLMSPMSPISESEVVGESMVTVFMFITEGVDVGSGERE